MGLFDIFRKKKVEKEAPKEETPVFESKVIFEDEYHNNRFKVMTIEYSDSDYKLLIEKDGKSKTYTENTGWARQDAFALNKCLMVGYKAIFNINKMKISSICGTQMYLPIYKDTLNEAKFIIKQFHSQRNGGEYPFRVEFRIRGCFIGYLSKPLDNGEEEGQIKGVLSNKYAVFDTTEQAEQFIKESKEVACKRINPELKIYSEKEVSGCCEK